MIESKDQQYSESFPPPPPPWRQNAYNRPAMPTPPIPPMGGNFSGGSLPGVGDLLSQSWKILTGRFGLFLGIASVPAILQIIAMIFVIVGLFGVSAVLERGVSSMSLFLLGAVLTSFAGTLGLLSALWIVILLFHFWSQIALIYAASKKDSVSIVAAYRYAIGRTFSYLWLIIASGIIVTGGGFFFFFPGVLFFVLF